MRSSKMRKKVLLMGKSGSGKTSMRSMIFANFVPGDTQRLGVTTFGIVEGECLCDELQQFMSRQEGFMDSYLVNQRENVFRNVEVLIYVFDLDNMDMETDIRYYKSCMDAINEYSDDAKVFVLLHKVDLIEESHRDEIINEKAKLLKEITPNIDSVQATSIWNETLCKAWSRIVYKLIPNVERLETNLKQLSDVLEADEVILFERATCLKIACHSRRANQNTLRVDNVSTIIKRFKMSCSAMGSSFNCIELRNETFSTFIDLFTASTFIMVVISDPNISSVATIMNIQNAKKHFDSLEKLDQRQSAIGL